MQARLKDTINRLKMVSKQRTKRRKQEREQLRSTRRRIVSLESENAELRARLRPTKIEQHRYPAELVALAVFIVVQAGGSLRCAAAAVGFTANLLGWPYGCPSHTTVREWVLRCGYQALLDTRRLSGRYAVIIDESIQVGKEKLLLMLGVKLHQDINYCAPLKGQDVVVLGLEVQSCWDGESIYQFITRNLGLRPAVETAYFISDRGSSILAAIRRLDTIWISDCTHVMMNIIKELFSQDQALSKLRSQIGRLRQKLTLAKWNGLLPASIRDRDRFLRIFTIVDWAKRMDTYWSKLPVDGRRHIAFYRRAGDLLRRLSQVRDLVALAANILKTAGLSEQSRQRWRDASLAYQNKQVVMTHKARKFIKHIDHYFDQHHELFRGKDQLLCCSDIVESTFGRYKNKGGVKAISADVLSIPLYNRHLSVQFVFEALKNVSGQQVVQWQSQNVCHNRYGLRKQMNQKLKNTVPDT